MTPPATKVSSLFKSCSSTKASTPMSLMKTPTAPDTYQLKLKKHRVKPAVAYSSNMIKREQRAHTYKLDFQKIKNK